MVSPATFLSVLAESGVDYYTGVPDSLLKDFLAYLETALPSVQHITAANEGNAVAIAAGYHLATSKVAAVYLQNSGLGNAVNPLTSLAARDVYAIPMLLIIGWRGESGVHDEPQHVMQGRITPALLDTLEIPYATLTPEMDAQAVRSEVVRLLGLARQESRPVALVMRAGVFEAHAAAPRQTQYSLGREEAIGMVVEALPQHAIVISTTGKISRELYEMRKKRGEDSRRDFLTVGSMGHASQIALAVAEQKKNRPVYCLDGDGATIMHLGGLATVGWVQPHNFRHIVLNNLAHESVGGQPSAAGVIDLVGVARSCGYASAVSVDTKESLAQALAELSSVPAPAFLEIKVNLGSRKDLGRPKETPVENKQGFMRYLGEEV